MMGFDWYLMNLDGAVHLRCLYITMFPRLMLLFVNWFMPYGVVVTIVLMFWLINCSRQTFILSLNYLNVGASYCTNVVFCCYFLNVFQSFFTHFIIFSLFMGSACYWNKVKWSEESRGNYIATSNNMKLVHWPLMGGLVHLVQRWGDWAGLQPAQAPPRCTKYNSLPINGQYTNHRITV